MELTRRNVVNGATRQRVEPQRFWLWKTELPILNVKTIYNEAKPYLWTAPEQVAYEFEIYYEGVLYGVKPTVVTANKTYSTVNILPNNKDYTIKVRVKTSTIYGATIARSVSISYEASKTYRIHSVCRWLNIGQRIMCK